MKGGGVKDEGGFGWAEEVGRRAAEVLGGEDGVGGVGMGGRRLEVSGLLSRLEVSLHFIERKSLLGFGDQELPEDFLSRVSQGRLSPPGHGAVNRDTQKCAYKVSYAEVEGEGMEVFKQPITDSGKTSKKGRLTLERGEDGTYITVQHGKGDLAKDLLVPIFEDGTLLQEYTFEEVKQRADQGLQDFDIIKFLQESKN
ncbi:Nicotinamide phosphoribosyltransferase [Portunus trituberculatus]|uniref:Nicotinamide phosphoribosyltransferase n=1 Tax=Portunus trituberculatus TaxID=210409 RepID=A0A5B7FMA2_PORTR|nr:Nicotinamide phosphoribosyltransferase [Portunus trituberculatus]